ncbi:MAG TPA: glycosyltransferase family 4 protein [Chitinophagaceae bacterium]|nr:glycosyltransferase family 4 protein [Chitinophagaceae bacterium]
MGAGKKKVLILCPSPRGTAATQRLKYEQYLDALEKEGYQFTISSFQTKRFWDIVYKPGRTMEKIGWTAIGYLRRLGDLLRSPFYDGVFVNLWVTPLGFPLFERLLFLFNKNVIYDIDDMIFITRYDHLKTGFVQRLKGRKKPMVMMKNAKYVIVCTPKLEEIAASLNKDKRVVDISSTFDTERFVPVMKYEQKNPLTIGWTGTHSTLPFLESLQPVLAAVSRQRPVKLLVIANKEYKMKDVPTEFIQWTAEREVEDLHQFDIGLYPIPANEWSLGKSSLKALTYMAIAIPFVATAYGTNYRIMQQGVQGFLATSEQEWISSLLQLIDDPGLRKRMGQAGRKTVEELFSLQANFPKYLHVFKTVIPTN